MPWVPATKGLELGDIGCKIPPLLDRLVDVGSNQSISEDAVWMQDKWGHGVATPVAQLMVVFGSASAL